MSVASRRRARGMWLLSGFGGGGGEPATLDILARVGTFNSPTSAGVDSVSGVGFQPKAVLPFGVLADGLNNGSFMGIGAFDGTRQFGVGVNSDTGKTTSATYRAHSDSSAVYVPISFANPTTTRTEASGASLDADGFSLDWTNNVSLPRLLNHISLGGADLEVSLTQHQMNSDSSPQSLAHGLSGGPPSALLFFGVVNNTAPPDTKAGSWFSIGAWAEGQSFCGAIRSNSAVSTSFTRKKLSDSSVFEYIYGRSIAVDSTDAENVNISYVITTDPYRSYFWMLAIGGAKSQVGAFSCNGLLDPLAINCPGISPKLFLPVFVADGLGANANTVTNNLTIAIGASDGINTVSCGITDQDNVTTTLSRRYQSSASLVEKFVYSGATSFDATVSFGEESVIISPTVNTGATWGQGGYLIIGS